MEKYGVSLRIQSECGKIRTRNNSVFGTFHAVKGWIKRLLATCINNAHYRKNLHKLQNFANREIKIHDPSVYRNQCWFKWIFNTNIDQHFLNLILKYIEIFSTSVYTNRKSDLRDNSIERNHYRIGIKMFLLIITKSPFLVITTAVPASPPSTKENSSGGY